MRSAILKLSIVIVLIGIFTSFSMGQQLLIQKWVDASYGSGGDGSPLHPFDTIQEGVDALSGSSSANVTKEVCVLAGTYTENVVVSNKGITIKVTF